MLLVVQSSPGVEGIVCGTVGVRNILIEPMLTQ